MEQKTCKTIYYASWTVIAAGLIGIFLIPVISAPKVVFLLLSCIILVGVFVAQYAEEKLEVVQKTSLWDCKNCGYNLEYSYKGGYNNPCPECGTINKVQPKQMFRNLKG